MKDNVRKTLNFVYVAVFLFSIYGFTALAMKNSFNTALWAGGVAICSVILLVYNKKK